jgi:hypothetical protein
MPMKSSKQAYRGCSIVWWAEQIPGTKFWKGKAQVSDGYGGSRGHRLQGPADRFKTEKEAREDIFQAAKQWVDDRLK